MIPFPAKVLDQHAAVLGKTGSGKSSAVRVVVEHLLDHGKRVCVIDPKGDWFGLAISADGKGAGYPVITFGDFKAGYEAHVPLNKESGKHVAELITSGNRPAVIGFRGWFTSDMLHFWIDFAKTLFHSNEGELFLIIDEAQNFAPKGSLKSIEGRGGTALHWTNRLLAEGRGLGINIWVCSQRPQKVHNDTLDGCETLVAMRVVHPAARGAIKDWIEGAEDKESGKEVLDSVGGMKRGEAIIWSPEIEFGPKRVQFPMFQTFDSFAPPQLQKKVNQRSWADVDLEEVKSKLASVIAEAKQNDPKALRAEINRLQSALHSMEGRVTTEIKEVKIPILPDKEDIARFTKEIERLDGVRNALECVSLDVKESVALLKSWQPARAPFPAHITDRSPLLTGQPTTPRKDPKAGNFSGNHEEIVLGKCERSILTALAQSGPSSAERVAVLTGYSSGSGGFNNSLSKLRTHDLINRGQPIQITADGLNELGDYKPLPTGQALLEYWLNKLGKCESAILETLARDGDMTAEQVAEKTGYSSGSGGFNNSLSRLRTLELITRGQPIRISENLKP